MFRALFCLCLALFAPTAQAGCAGHGLFDTLDADRQAALLTAAHKDRFGAGILWQVDGGGHRSYVLGTMHIPDPRLDSILTTVQPLLGKVEAVYVEMTKAEEKAFQKQVISTPATFSITDGPSLIDRLSPEEWGTLSDIAKRRGMPSFVVAKFQPWFLDVTLSIPACAIRDLRAGKRGLDRMLEARATKAGLPVQSLDTSDALIAMLTRVPLDEQVADLKAALAAGLYDLLGHGTGTDLYFRQEQRLMWDAAIDIARQKSTARPDWFEKVVQNEQQALLADRNQLWAPVITQQMQQRPILVAVGAAHLFGEAGVLAQLERDGFKLTRLPVGIH